jgi:hypothetical protein
MLVIRRIGAAILASAAIAVFFLMAPTAATVAKTTDHHGDLRDVASNFSSDNSSADYIYGQILATGVATKDTLAVLVTQADEADARQAAIVEALGKSQGDDRIAAEMVLLVATAALFLVTDGRGRPRTSDENPSTMPSLALPSGANVLPTLA